MIHVVVPSVLAAQAGGRNSFDVEADTVGEALRALPVADLVLDERGEVHPRLVVYVDGTEHRERSGLESPIAGARELRVVALDSGG
jgi:hypothetical protein